MSRRQFVQAAAAAGAAVSTGAGRRVARADQPAAEAAGTNPLRRPNVLVIQPDTHRGSVLGCAGDPMAVTPHLDRLASQGIRFTRAVANNPVCTPCRGCIQTGMHSHTNGLMVNDKRLDPRWTCLADVFAEAGYATGYAGKWHLDGGKFKPLPGGYIPPQRRRGWQAWEAYEKGHDFDKVWRLMPDGSREQVKGYDWEPAYHTDVALDFAKRHRDANTPWVYYISYGPPHQPEECLREFLDRFPKGDIRLPDWLPDKTLGPHKASRQPDLVSLYQMFYAQVMAVDHEMGRLMKGLDQLGVADGTVVLYTSDHGDMLGEHGTFRGKCKPHAASGGVPMIVRWPGRINAGQTCDAPVGSVDIAPTLFDLVGLDTPDTMQGVSFADWCLEGEGKRQPAQYLECGYGDWRAVWDERHVYSPHWKILYDHAEDPHEQRNLFDRDDKLCRQLHDLLLETARATADPKLPELKGMVG